MPLKLAGVRVDVNGLPAPLMLVSAGQVNFQCPQLAPGTTLRIEVTTSAGSILRAADSQMSAAAPAIVLNDGTNRAMVQALDPSNAKRVRIYAVGVGETEKYPAQGMPAPSDPPMLAKNRALVSIGGREVQPFFVGLVPGLTGVFQLDLDLPAIPTGVADIFVRVELADGTSFVSQPAKI
jgi:uncharacterized protein (TIGR03437 family)